MWNKKEITAMDRGIQDGGVEKGKVLEKLYFMYKKSKKAGKV